MRIICAYKFTVHEIWLLEFILIAVLIPAILSEFILSQFFKQKLIDYRYGKDRNRKYLTNNSILIVSYNSFRLDVVPSLTV